MRPWPPTQRSHLKRKFQTDIKTNSKSCKQIWITYQGWAHTYQLHFCIFWNQFEEVCQTERKAAHSQLVMSLNTNQMINKIFLFSFVLRLLSVLPSMICQATQAYVTKKEALQKEMEPYKKQTENQEGKPKPWHINSFTLPFYFDLLLWRPYTSFNIVLKKSWNSERNTSNSWANIWEWRKENRGRILQNPSF